MALQADVRIRLVEASQGNPTWSEIGAKLRDEASELDDALVSFVWAFDYSLKTWSEPDSKADAVFVPMLGYTDGSSYPPVVEAVEDERLGAWADAADIDGPALASRLHDLLWERQWGPEPHRHARAAWSAYMELSDGPWAAIYRAECLVRALQLARSLNDLSLEGDTVQRSISFVRASISGDDAKPGAPFQVLRSLIDLPRDRRPNELDSLLLACEEVFGEDDFLSESLAQLKMAQASDAEELARLRSVLVERWLATATEHSGLRRFSDLRHALGLAESYGLADVANRIRRDIQQVPYGDDDFKEVAVDVSIPRAVIEDFTSSIIGDDDWRGALVRLGAVPPPSGNHVDNLAAIERQKAEHPLLFLITKVIYGPHGFPIQVVRDEELHAQVALSEHERMSIEFGGLLIGDVLDKVRGRYGDPSAEDLTAFFTSALIPPEIAERVGASLLHYWRGHWDECAHVLCPRIEAILRMGLMNAGVTVIAMPTGRRPGRVKSLGVLLEEAMQHDLFSDHSIARYLYNLLCDPYGMNLRNSIAHGFITRVRREEAALLVQVVCRLSLLRVAPRDEDT